MEIRDRLKCLDTTLLIFLLFWLSPARSEAQNATPLVIQGGTLIDATGRPPLEDAVIVIEGNRFKAVGKRGEVAVPTGKPYHRRERQDDSSGPHRRPLSSARLCR
jgi:hypothetical protein